MGCMPTKRFQKQPALKFLLNDDYLSKITLAAKVELRGKALNSPCRRFVIPEPESKIFRLDVIKLYQYGMTGGKVIGEKMLIILRDMQNIKSCKNYFLTNLHQVCIPDFSIEIGLLTLVLYFLSRNSEIKVSKSFPYLAVTDKESKELLKSWNEYIELLYKVQQDYLKNSAYTELKKKTEYLISKFQKKPEENGRKALKYFSKILSAFNEYTDEFLDSLLRVSLFCEFYLENTEKIQEISSKLSGVKFKNFENLVHFLYPRPETIN